MKVKVNGKETDVNATNITALLGELQVDSPEQVVVELNGAILNRPEFDASSVKEGDEIEFLYFMGGGRGTQ